MTRLVVGLAILSVAAMASADPTVTFSFQDMGAGIYQHTFTINDPNPAGGASFFVEMEYRGAQGAEVVALPGTMCSIKAFGNTDIMKESDAFGFATNDPTYDSARDTWLKADFEFGIQALVETHNVSLYSESGTESAVGWNTVEHAQVCCTGDVYFTGRIARETIWYDVSGTSPAPEPATLMLLALGGVGFVLRRKR